MLPSPWARRQAARGARASPVSSACGRLNRRGDRQCRSVPNAGMTRIRFEGCFSVPFAIAPWRALPNAAPFYSVSPSSAFTARAGANLVRPRPSVIKTARRCQRSSKNDIASDARRTSRRSKSTGGTPSERRNCASKDRIRQEKSARFSRVRRPLRRRAERPPEGPPHGLIAGAKRRPAPGGASPPRQRERREWRRAWPRSNSSSSGCQ